MKTTYRTGLLIQIAIIFGITNLSAYAGTLDGKTFTGTTGKMDKKSTEQDEVSFENGQFNSVGFAEYGFKPGSYVTTVEGNVTHFVADI